ncbi:MAG: class I SAM-dependent methyltransferase [Alphaproteobacteria bacterium]
MEDSDLTTQEDFWSAHPCGIDAPLAERRRHRHIIEPWLPAYLKSLANGGRLDCLEVGCGQGTDAIEICRHLAPGSSYHGIDFSPESIAVSERSLREEVPPEMLNTVPQFATGDALDLDFPDDRFDRVFSLGVLHHTPDPAAAVREVHRVLKPGGTCHVFLYRTFSAKVGVAKILRGVQRASDVLTRRERSIYAMFLEKRSALPGLGTMLHECFGVPHMYSYTRPQVTELFAPFASCEVIPFGYNLPSRRPRSGHNSLGNFWNITATK